MVAVPELPDGMVRESGLAGNAKSGDRMLTESVSEWNSCPLRPSTSTLYVPTLDAFT